MKKCILIVIIFVAVPVVCVYAKTLPETPTEEDRLREAGKYLGANCDVSEAFAYLATVKGGNMLGIQPRQGNPGIDANFACRLAGYIKAVKALGCVPKFISGYRNYKKQLDMCGYAGKPGCSRPGYSCHQYGAAVDLSGASNGEGCKQATGELAEKYALIFGYSAKAMVPPINREVGKNHFQCIENKTSGTSSGCNKNACGTGTPPPPDPTQWDYNMYSRDPGPDPYHDNYEIPPDYTSTDPNYATLIDNTYDGQYTDSDFYEDTEGDTDWVNLENPEDEVATGTDDSYGNYSYDEDEDWSWLSGGETDEQGGSGGSIDQANQDIATPQNTLTADEIAQRQKEVEKIKERSLVYNIITNPSLFTGDMAEKSWTALFGDEKEKEVAQNKIYEFIAEKEILQRQEQEREVAQISTPPDIFSEINSEPWNFEQREESITEVLAVGDLLSKDIPPQESFPWWRIMLRMFEF